MPLHTLIIGHSICKWLEHYLLTKKDRRLSADFNIKEMTTVAWHGIGGRTPTLHLLTRSVPKVMILNAISSADDSSVTSLPPTIRTPQSVFLLKISNQPRGKYFTYINQKCYFLLWLFQLRWTLIQHFQVFHVNKPNTCFAVRVISQKSCDLKARIPQRQDGGTK
jgi:hypothetical protein